MRGCKMPYVSAKYMPRGELDLPNSARPIQAVDHDGLIWSFREDSQVGDWLEYIKSGGKIDDEDPPE